ncbi:hypothetical protein DFH09DRAFT_1316472 [Mycena vulgaris]|nr:hypothetical protein DFH09DRAFT_1316472 [Mycena vulgaris]
MFISARQRIPPTPHALGLPTRLDSVDRKVPGESRAQSGSRCIDSRALGEGSHAAVLTLRRASSLQVCSDSCRPRISPRVVGVSTADMRAPSACIHAAQEALGGLLNPRPLRQKNWIKARIN